MLKSDWVQKSLGDLGNIITGKTPSTKITDYWNGDIPFVTPKDIQATKHILSTERTVSSEGLKAVRSSRLPESAVCVSCIGNIGYLGITTKTSVSNQQINSIVVNKDNDANFVYYLLKTLWPFFKNYEGQSTAISILNKTQFSKIPVLVPEINVQKKIASVLSVLDDKIELNTRINDNLQQQAQTLFDAWFVNYLPFGGVRPTKWKPSNIYALSEIIYGAPFKSKLFNTDGNGMPIVRIRDLKSSVLNTYTTEIHPKGYLLQDGDIVVGMDGEFRPYIWGNGSAWLNQRVCVFANKRPCGKFFLFFTIKPLLYEIEQTEQATTVIHIGKQDFDRFEFYLPDNEIIDKFDDFTMPMYREIVRNQKESIRLSNIRDALLPRLMSGELDVSDIEL